MGKERRTYADRRAYLLAYEANRVAMDTEYRDRRRRHKREWAARSRAKEKNMASGVIVMGEEDFVQFESCMKAPQKPTELMVEAAQLHEKLRQH